MKKSIKMIATFIVIVSQTLPLTVKATTATNSNLSSVNPDSDTTLETASSEASTSSISYTDHFCGIDSSYQILTVNVCYTDGSAISLALQPITSTATATITDDYAELDVFSRANLILNNRYRIDATTAVPGTSTWSYSPSFPGGPWTSWGYGLPIKLISGKFESHIDSSNGLLPVHYSATETFDGSILKNYTGTVTNAVGYIKFDKVSVTSKYVDSDGKAIAGDEVSSGYYGETYTTEQKAIDGYTFKEVQGNASGTFTDQSQTVTYVYTKDPIAGGDVTASYVDTDGNKISDDVVQTGNVGDTYTTEQKAIKGYTFKEIQGSATGTFTDQAQTVTYVYTKDPVAGGDVTAKYVDTDGNKISDDVVQTGNVGDVYKTEQKTIDAYTLKEVQGSATGTFTDQAQTVTYVYTKDPVAGGDVTAKYVDTDGNKISDDVVKTGNVGDTYKTDQKSIDGYTFKEVQGSATGTFTDQAQTVTYVYTKDPVAGGDVTAKYVDTDGNKISDDVVKTGNVGDTYKTDQKSIDGYTFKEVQGSATGTFTDQAQTVTYVYTKDPVAGGDVTAKYVDTDGNKISDDVVKTGNVGDAYTTEQKTIDGYTFKEVQGSAVGTFTDQAQTVTYIYTKNTINPTPNPEDHSKTNPSDENKAMLPQTGENESASIFGMVTGLFMLIGTSILIIFKRKR